MAKIPSPGRREQKWQKLAKHSKDTKCYVAHTGKTDKTTENNEIVDTLTSDQNITICQGKKSRINQKG